MKRLALVLILLVACNAPVSEGCAHAAARWNATIGPYSDVGQPRGLVLNAPLDIDVVKHRNAVARRLELVERYPDCFASGDVQVAEEQFAALEAARGG